MRNILILLLAAVSAAVCGCAVQRLPAFDWDERATELLKLRGEPLPYRVAVAPVEADIKTGRVDIDTYSAIPDAARIRETLVNRFDRYRIFRNIAPIEAQPGMTGRAALLESAWKQGYDLLATFRVRRNEVIYTGTNGFYTPNFFLFLAGVVGSYFVPDETYEARIEIETVIYSVDTEKELFRKVYKGVKKLDLDDFQRGWMFHGYFAVPGALGESNWLKVSETVSPFAWRELELSMMKDFLTGFRRVAAGDVFRKGMQKTLALVVGLQEHESTVIPDVLQFARRDAAAVDRALRRSGTGVLLDKHVQTLINEKATRRTFTDAMKKIQQRAGPDDRVIIYFAGYGAADKSGRAYLVTYDANPKFLDRTAIPLDALAGAVNRMRAKQVTVFLDAAFCSSRRHRALTKRNEPPESVFRNIAARGGVSLMTAGGPGEGAMELRANKHGIFTFYLLSAMKAGGADRDRDGRITARELFDYMKEKVSVEASLEGFEQTPRWYGGGPDDSRLEGFPGLGTVAK